MTTRKAKMADTGQEVEVTDEGLIEFPDDDQPSEAELDREMAVNNWIADLGGHDDAAIVVYEMDPKSNRLAYVESLGAQEMDGPTLFKKLKEEYGGGKFRIQMRADGRIRKTQTVVVKPPPKIPASPFGGMNLPELIREIKGESRGNDTQLILQMMQQQNQQFQTLMVEMIKGMGQRDPGPPPMGLGDLVGALASLKELSAPQKGPEPTELILKGVELVNAIRGDSDGGGEANMYTLLQSAVKELGGTISEAAKVLPGSVPNMITPQKPQTNPMQITADDTARPREPVEGDRPRAPVETQSRNEIPEQLKPFEPYVNSLVQMAAADKDPELYAEVIIDQLGDQYAYAWVGAREGREMLLGIFTQAQPYAAWFEKVGTIIAEILNDSGDDDSSYSESDESDDNGDIDSAPDGSHNADDSTALDDESAHVQDGPAKDPARSPFVDGYSDGSGRDSSDAAIDGAAGQSVQDPSPHT